MPRKGPAPRRKLMPDPVYRSLLVTQLVNKILLSGKRSIAEKIVYDALKIVEEKTGAEPGATQKGGVDKVKAPREVGARVTVPPSSSLSTFTTCRARAQRRRRGSTGSTSCAGRCSSARST